MTAGLLDTMVRIQHPRVEEHFLEAMQTLCARSRHDYGIYWLGRIIPRLSLRVVEPLEKLIPEMSDRVADEIIPYITELKSTA